MQTGFLEVTVVVEGAVRIDIGVAAFINNVVDEALVEQRRYFGTGTPLYAMVGPQHLLLPVESNDFSYLAIVVVGGKAPMVGRVPVTRSHNQLKMLLNIVDDGYDGIALGYGQRTAG